MRVYPSLERLESRIAPAGIVLMEYSETTGILRLTGDSLNNAFEIFQVSPGTYRVEGRDDAATLTETSIDQEGNGATTIGNVRSLIIATGAGDDEIDLSNLRNLSTVAIETEAGNDSIRAFNLSTRGDLDFDLGSGTDAVRFTGLSSVIAGNASFTSTGSAAVNFGAARVTVSGALDFNGGSGSDVLSTSAESSLTVRKGINFTGGGSGNDEINFGDQGIVTIGRNAAGQSVSYEGGLGDDSISIGAHRVALTGSIDMNGGGGNDSLDLDGVSVSVGQNLQGNSISLVGAAGLDEIDIAGSTVRVAGVITLDGGIDADVLDLTDIHRLVASSINLNGGIGSDQLTLEADVLKLRGGMTMIGGEDADLVTIEADGSISGLVDLQLGETAAGTQTTEIRGRSGMENSLRIGGGLTVNANGDDSSVDHFRLTNVVIAAPVSLAFSDGISDVDIDNLTALDTLAIETRGGADDVRIERDAIYGISVFARGSTISLGAGDDILQIGKDSTNNRVEVRNSLMVDGGPGSDGRNDIRAANRFAGTASFNASAFEEENLA